MKKISRITLILVIVNYAASTSFINQRKLSVLNSSAPTDELKQEKTIDEFLTINQNKLLMTDVVVIDSTEKWTNDESITQNKDLIKLINYKIKEKFNISVAESDYVINLLNIEKISRYDDNDNNDNFLATISITALKKDKMVIDQNWFRIIIRPIRTNISLLHIDNNFTFQVTWGTSIDALTSDSNLHHFIKESIKTQTGCIVQENIDYTVTLTSVTTAEDHDTKQIVANTKLLVTINSKKNSKIFSSYSFNITAQPIIYDINAIIKQKNLGVIYSEEIGIFTKKAVLKAILAKNQISLTLAEFNIKSYTDNEIVIEGKRRYFGTTSLNYTSNWKKSLLWKDFLSQNLTIKSFLKTSAATYIGTDEGLYFKRDEPIAKSRQFVKILNVGVLSLAIKRNGNIYAGGADSFLYEIRYNSLSIRKYFNFKIKIISLYFANNDILYIGSKDSIYQFDIENKILTKKVDWDEIGEIHCLEWEKNNNENLFFATKSKIYQVKNFNKLTLTEVKVPESIKPIINADSRLYASITNNTYELIPYDLKTDNKLFLNDVVGKSSENYHGNNYKLKKDGIYFSENYIRSLDQIRIMPQIFYLNRKTWIKDLSKELKIDTLIKTKINEQLDIDMTVNETDYLLKIVNKGEFFNHQDMTETMKITVSVRASNNRKFTGSFSFDAIIIFTAKDLSKIKISDPKPPIYFLFIEVNHDQPTAKLVTNDKELRTYINLIIHKKLKIDLNEFIRWDFTIEAEKPEQILKVGHYNFITFKITSLATSDKIYGSFKLTQKFIIYSSKDPFYLHQTLDSVPTYNAD